MKRLASTFFILGMFLNNLFCQDLIVTLDPISPDKVFLPTYTENTTIILNGSVANAGSVATDSFKLRIYFSSDTIIDYSDLLQFDESYAGLAPGETLSFSNSLGLWRDMTMGKYHFIAQVDYLNTVAETDETNNISFAQFTIIPRAPDLSPAVYNMPAMTGLILSLTVWDFNVGALAAGAHKIGYYFSTDNLYDGGDRFLKKTSVGPLPNGIANTVNEALDLSFVQDPGTYYIIIVDDIDSEVGELNENNNVAVVQIDIEFSGNDLFISQLSAANESVTPGSTLTINGTGMLTGYDEVENLTVDYYLSTDSIYNASDSYRLSSRSYNIIFPGTFSLDESLSIPASFPYGNYYLIVYLGTNILANEFSETNNYRSVKIKIEPDKTDLKIDSLAVSVGYESVTALSTLTITGRGMNSGNVDAENFSTAYYLSSDSVYHSSDYFLGSQTDSLVSAGSSFRLDKNLTIPMSIQDGYYYLIARLDTSNAVAEYNDMNNFAAVKIMIGPDLAIGSLTLSDPIAQPGTFIFVTQSETNLGNIPVKNHFVGYFLSKDSIYDPADTYLTPNFLAGLNGHDSIIMNPALFIPISADTGRYFILAIADYGDEVAEVNEDNNTKAFAVTLNYNYDGTTNIKPADAMTSNNTFYPNPTSGAIYFTTEFVVDEMEILNMNGDRLLNLKSANLQGTSLDLSKLQSGVYHIKTKKEGAVPAVQKLVITK